MSEPSQTSAIAGEAIVGLTTTGVEVDPTMPDYNADHFEWEGACWDLVSDPDLDIALVLPGGNSGLQEEFAARLANILRLNVENLYVEECYANKGPTMKRIHPRAQGRAYRIEKRTSHITIVLNER